MPAPRRLELRDHRWFGVALLVGVLVRVVAMAAYWPAIAVGDSRGYLLFSLDIEPSPYRVVGYCVWLWAIAAAGDGLWLISGLQHLLGLGAAVGLYALLRRRGCGQRLATLAVLPLLLDGMQLLLEHAILSDLLFEVLLVAAVVVLAWRRTPGLGAIALCGFLLGIATLVRVSGQPTVLAAALFVVLTVVGWRARMARVAVLVAVFAAPLLGYATWSAANGESFGLTEAGGRSLYMRTTTFVDCDRLAIPDYERPLCPEEPLGSRRDPTYYGWHDPDSDHGLRADDLPPGVLPEDAMQDFALRAIRAQPLDYTRVVLRDLALTFAPARTDFFEYDTAWKWTFSGFYGYEPTLSTTAIFEDRNGGPPDWDGPLSLAMLWYGRVVYLWGPLAAVLLALGVSGVLRRPRRGEEDQRPTIVLLLALAAGLVLVPALSVEFIWRYTLPVVTFVPAAAALAWRQRQGASREDNARGGRRAGGRRSSP